ncbi:MAG: HDIG domain-containing protein [Clostridiales bacterium]|nr:HDIG domain-containing protein [Clostridiales bacterium]
MTGKRKKQHRVLGSHLLGTLIALTAFALLFVVLCYAVTPERYDINVGQPAPTTLKASKDVEDKLTTDKLRQDAANAVKSIYVYDDTAADAVKASLSEGLNALKATLGGEGEFTAAELTAEELSALEGADETELDSAFTHTVEGVYALMGGRLEQDGLEEALGAFTARLKEEGHAPELAETMAKIAAAYIKPNYYYDEVATEAVRQAERAKVQPVTRIKGEVIVSDGEIVTQAQYQMLYTLGMINESSFDLWLYLGIALLVLTLLLSVGLYLYMFEPKIYGRPRKLTILTIVSVLVILSCVAVREVNVYIMPVTLGVLLISLLISRRAALFVNIPLAIMASTLAASGGSLLNMTTYTVVISSLVSGTVALRVLKAKQSRLQVMLAGLASGLSCVLATFAVRLISSASVMETLFISLYSGLSCVLAGLLCIAVTPAFEAIFNVVTTTRLIELSNPNHPLLRRLLLEAPGTYHHSIIVANLAEAAAAEVGANGLLARVGAYYHDVGKINRPAYFTENQLGDNPHDRTDPRVSTAIITAHVKDGLSLLREYRLPEEIRLIAASHHGTSPVLFFYNKSLTENGEANINDFRYPGPRPQTKEAAIVMLADTVEAASRSLTSPDTESLKALIEKLVRAKTEDGQLDDSPLSFADISKINAAFVTVLSGAFHERIEYPNVEIPKEEQP